MSEGNARILLWGIAGSGKSTTLSMIHSKLQADLRGELRRDKTAIDPTVYYETLPIRLGKVGGVDSQIEIVAVPGAEDQAITRKQLLDEVDGIILLIDSSPDRIETNWEMITELQESLSDYGRSIGDFPIVVQYNKRDVADPFAIEDFHRRTGLTQAAVFETIATSGHGVLATLTTISKHVVRSRKAPKAAAQPITTLDDTHQQQDVDDNATSHEILEAAILAEADSLDSDDVADVIALEFTSPGVESDPLPKTQDALGNDLRIVSVGDTTIDPEGALRLPLVLGDSKGQTRSVVLTLRLDGLLDQDGD